MKRFLFCSTVFNKKQYTLFDYEDVNKMVEKFNYLLNHRENPVLWPCYSKEERDELINMDPKNIAPIFKGVSNFYVQGCKIKCGGWTYEVYEITLSNILKGYWKVTTEMGIRHLDPATITFLGC